MREPVWLSLMALGAITAAILLAADAKTDTTSSHATHLCP